MSDDSKVQVEFTAQIQSLLSGMGKAHDAVKEATEGMTGSISKMAETIESMGVAALGLAAVGLAFEGIKASVEYVLESIEATTALAKSFATLKYSTGASNQEMNQYVAAIQLSGGSTEDLTGLMQGMTRAVKSNAEGLVMNGVAADKASLANMTFGDYMVKVNEIANEMASPLQKNEFLMLALGRAGAKTGMLLDEFVKHAEEAKGVQIISPFAIEQMHQMEEAEGRLKNADQAYAAGVSAWASVMKMAWLNVKAAATEHANASNDAMELARRGFIQSGNAADDWRKNVILDMDLAIAKAKEWNAAYAEGLRTSKDSMDAGAHRAGEENKKTYVDPHAKDDSLKQAEAAQKLAEQTMLGQVAAAKQAYQAKKDALNQSVADEATTKMEALAQEKAAVMTESAAELAAVNTRISKLSKADINYAAEFAKLQNEKKAIVAATEHQIAELTLKGTQEQAKARTELQKRTDEADKEIAAMAKETAREETQAAKDGLANQTAALNQKVATTRMSAQQELAARVQLQQQTATMEVQALTQEQQREGISTADWQKLQNKKLDAARQNATKIQELENQSLAKQRAQWEGFFGSMTGGFSKSITGLIHGTMTWGQAFQNVLSSALDGLINFFVQWGIQEAIKWAASLVMQKTTGVSEATGAAAVYAVNAMASAAAIPVYGWAMAPGVGAEAYSSGLAMAAMASAAGGWDQVPSDQVAQIHKNEMVMSAPLATGIRDMVANQGSGGGGGNSGGGNVIHVHAMDAKSVKQFLGKSSNRSALAGALGGMARNGRRS
jgi:hypothetical protein